MFVVVCCSLLFLVVVCWALLLFVVTGNVARTLVCWASLLFVVTGNVTRTRASIIRRRGYITGTGIMAQVSSPDG